MRYRNAHKSLKTLYAVAAGQGGYFTAKQAASAGYDYPHLAYHLQVGNFERAAHGLYRLPTIPPVDNDDLIRLSLWSRGRDDVPQAVISHASALFLHQLSDVMPSKIHLTVPPSFRKAAPRNCLLHKAHLTAAETEPREGFAVTTPLRTLFDVAGFPGVTKEQFDLAIREAIRRGLVRRSVVKQKLGPVLSPARREHLIPLNG